MSKSSLRGIVLNAVRREAAESKRVLHDGIAGVVKLIYDEPTHVSRAIDEAERMAEELPSRYKEKYLAMVQRYREISAQDKLRLERAEAAVTLVEAAEVVAYGGGSITIVLDGDSVRVSVQIEGDVFIADTLQDVVTAMNTLVARAKRGGVDGKGA